MQYEFPFIEQHYSVMLKYFQTIQFCIIYANLGLITIWILRVANNVISREIPDFCYSNIFHMYIW